MNESAKNPFEPFFDEIRRIVRDTGAPVERSQGVPAERIQEAGKIINNIGPGD